MSVKTLKPIAPQPGRPLYITARDAVREAIDVGIFTPGEQMPSTKELSSQLSVSLVTAHRALQELVTTGVLSRSQGRGTFVHERYLERKKTMSDTRVGLIFHAESSLADYYHSQILEGVRQASQHLAVDLIMLRFGEDIRGECNGYLFVNPLGDEADQLATVAKPKQPIMAIGAKVHNKRVSCVDVDNVDLARQAVAHLISLGHTQIAYVGGADEISNSLDRWNGFLAACAEPLEWNEAGRGGHLAALIAEEVARAPRLPFGVPALRDARLRRLAEALSSDPASDFSLEQWAQRCGASARTLARLFRAETGMGFARWRQALRLTEAAALLAQGASPAQAAASVGYASAPAFGAAFRAAFGITPGEAR